MKNTLKQNFKFKPKNEQKKIEFNNNINTLNKEKNNSIKTPKKEIQITINLSSKNEKINKINKQKKKQIPVDNKTEGITKQNSSLKNNKSNKSSFINKKNNNINQNVHEKTKKNNLTIKDLNVDKKEKSFKFKPKKICTNQFIPVSLTSSEKTNQKLNNSNSSNQIKNANYKKDFYIPRVCASLIGNNLDNSFSSNNSYSRLNFSEIRRQHLMERKNSLNVSTHSSSTSNYNSNENIISNFNFEKVLDDLNGIIELNQKNGIENKDNNLKFKKSNSLRPMQNKLINELENVNIKKNE